MYNELFEPVWITGPMGLNPEPLGITFFLLQLYRIYQ